MAYFAFKISHNCQINFCKYFSFPSLLKNGEIFHFLSYRRKVELLTLLYKNGVRNFLNGMDYYTPKNLSNEFFKVEKLMIFQLAQWSDEAHFVSTAYIKSILLKYILNYEIEP